MKFVIYKEVINIKEMVYKGKMEYLKEILDWGVWHNYEYIILSLHSHPTAYVCLKSDNVFSQKHYDDIPIQTHGGLTFAEPTLYRIKQYSQKYKCDVNTSITRNWIIGWDYGHYGDYSRVLGNSGKRYTTKEIFEDVKSVIKQLITKNKKEVIDMEEDLQFLLNNYKTKLDECDDPDRLPIIKDGSDVIEYLWDTKYQEIKIEDLDSDTYKRFEKIASENVETFKDILWDYKHPWSDWDNCDADFYGV